ncbi:MAG: FG-GAP repeat protein [Ignavibacteria bacterium]|nr:FG-GAP repeat protein [Ignavibacteria bacterium]
MNGDGYSDVIVGAPFNNAGGTDAGRAYIYFGGSAMNNVADLIMTGEAAGDQFGSSVSSAGDVNGDGYSDVIVGAILNDAGGTGAGRAYIYFGGSSMNNVADLIMTGEAGSDQFGVSVSSAGDVNGDGYSDVIVGANGNDAGGSNAGRAYIYFGGSAMNNVADVIMTGQQQVISSESLFHQQEM